MKILGDVFRAHRLYFGLLMSLDPEYGLLTSVRLQATV